MFDLNKFLGRGVQVYLINGGAMNFKPMEYVKGHDYWIGFDDEGRARTVSRGTIYAVIF